MSELQQSSSLIWVLCSLLVPAESSRGGSHLTQLSRGTQTDQRSSGCSLPALKKGNCGAPLTNVLLRRNTHWLLFSYSELIRQIPAAGGSFIFKCSQQQQKQAHAKTGKCLLCKYKQSSSFIYISLCRAFESEKIFNQNNNR